MSTSRAALRRYTTETWRYCKSLPPPARWSLWTQRLLWTNAKNANVEMSERKGYWEKDPKNDCEIVHFFFTSRGAALFHVFESERDPRARVHLDRCRDFWLIVRQRLLLNVTQTPIASRSIKVVYQFLFQFFSTSSQHVRAKKRSLLLNVTSLLQWRSTARMHRDWSQCY